MNRIKNLTLLNIEAGESKNNNYPPKKGKITVKSKNAESNLLTEDIDLIEAKTNKTKPKSKHNKSIKLFEKKFMEKDAKSEFSRKDAKSEFSRKDAKSEFSRKGKAKIIDFLIDKDNNNKKEKPQTEKIVNLDDFELNNLEYIEACELDKRTFCQTYISVLMREHLALVTFVAWKDYNLFYIKVERFILLFCTDMTMNGLFFVHESMHKKYTNGENFTFVQKLPQILFTLIVSHILEVLFCFLSMTDTHVYEIKALPKNDKKNGEKIMDIIDKIKRKLVAFFIVTFLLLLFYWYFISAFCAVYQNTQKKFLRDSFISFATSLVDPFIIYGITTILRKISLSLCCKKKWGCGCVYKISDLIPIF